MSVYWDILQACKTLAVAALPDLRVVVRKRPFFSADHGDAVPLLLLCPGAESVADEQMNKGVWFSYPVQAVLLQAEGSTLESPSQLQTQFSTRESLRLALWQPLLTGTGGLPDVPSVRDCDYEPQPAFDLGGLDRLFDCSAQLFTFTSVETRS